MRRSDRWAFGVFGIGVVVILGGVQLSAMLSDPPREPLAPESAFCPDRVGGAARADTRYRETAEPYRGAGPHLVDVVLAKTRVDEIEIPAQWRSGDAGTAPKPRLVACVYQDAAAPDKDRTCTYGPQRSLNLYGLSRRSDRPGDVVEVALMKSTYVFQLYEARTARPVGRFDVPGDGSCPFYYRADSGPTVAQEPDEKKVRAALRPYIERSVS